MAFRLEATRLFLAGAACSFERTRLSLVDAQISFDCAWSWLVRGQTPFIRAPLSLSRS